MKDVEDKKAALNQKLEVDMKEMEDEGLSENEVQVVKLISHHNNKMVQ